MEKFRIPCCVRDEHALPTTAVLYYYYLFFFFTRFKNVLVRLGWVYNSYTKLRVSLHVSPIEYILLVVLKTNRLNDLCTCTNISIEHFLSHSEYEKCYLEASIRTGIIDYFILYTNFYFASFFNIYRPGLDLYLHILTHMRRSVQFCVSTDWYKCTSIHSCVMFCCTQLMMIMFVN